jgi:hypothetical protein
MQPLGSLLVGAVSQSIGAPNTMLIEGLCALLIVALFWSFLSKKEEPAHKQELKDTNHPNKLKQKEWQLHAKA